MQGALRDPAGELDRLQHRHGHLRLARPLRGASATSTSSTPRCAQATCSRTPSTPTGRGRASTSTHAIPHAYRRTRRLGAAPALPGDRRRAVPRPRLSATSTGCSPSSRRTAGSSGATSVRATSRTATASPTRCAASSRAARSSATSATSKARCAPPMPCSGVYRKLGRLPAIYEREWTPAGTLRVRHRARAERRRLAPPLSGDRGRGAAPGRARGGRAGRRRSSRGSSWRATDGAVPGSFPLYGRYAPLQYPNWAAKFLADSLALRLRVIGDGR